MARMIQELGLVTNRRRCQHVALAVATRGADDALVFHLLDETGRPVVTDLELALDAGGGATADSTTKATASSNRGSSSSSPPPPKSPPPPSPSDSPERISSM
jgi:hypothetical protein